MQKITWEEILKSDLEFINLVGYGSLINPNTHRDGTKGLKTVLVKGFKRIYNIKLIPDNYTKSWLDNFEKYLCSYGYDKSFAKKLNEESECVLNCIYTGKNRDIVNGLLTKINRDSFEHYTKREAQYFLYKTKYYKLCPNTGKIDSCTEDAYILVAKNEQLIKSGKVFMPYHKNIVAGAYSIGKYFGELFERTTFDLEGNNIIF